MTMNKKGLQFKSAFFAIIIMGVIVTAVTVMLSGWANEYQSGVVPDLEAFDRIDVIAKQTNISVGKLSTGDPDPGTDPEANTFRGVYGILTNIFAPFRVVFGEGGMVDAAGERIGAPDYFLQAVVTMMLVTITFALVAIIFRLSRSSA